MMPQGGVRQAVPPSRTRRTKNWRPPKIAGEDQGKIKNFVQFKVASGKINVGKKPRLHSKYIQLAADPLPGKSRLQGHVVRRPGSM